MILTGPRQLVIPEDFGGRCRAHVLMPTAMAERASLSSRSSVFDSMGCLDQGGCPAIVRRPPGEAANEKVITIDASFASAWGHLASGPITVARTARV